MKKTILTVIITAIIVGGGLYFWQKAQIDTLRQEIQDLQTQNKEISEEKEASTDSAYKTSALCTDPPTGTDIGRDVYPVDPKYSNLYFFGQLFTAYGCGSDRVSKIFGVDGDNYTLGSGIWLKSSPSQLLIDTFESIGFISDEGDTSKWELWDTVKVDDIMKLEPYHKSFKADDCRNCG